IEGNGEHGPHSLAVGPDGSSIYLIAGNFSKMPPMDKARNVADTPLIDNLYPRLWGDTHDEHAKEHGGWIAKTDSVGKSWELIASGFRNPFDMIFNEAGDLFTFDSDMEWDLGSPWYRPTRICHVTSGAEFGWRKTTQKWSPVLPDNLPAIFNVGQGSPTGMVYGGKTNFPEKYRKSLFAFDWSFGIIYAFELEPNGSSYKVKGEEFVSGSPLPLTDGIVGPDGALYFLTGGRGLDGGLYRVYYGDNTQKVNPVAAIEPNEPGKIRRRLESYHGEPKADAIGFAWDYLNHEDRFIRYAARIAIEHQPVNEWRQKALSEKDPIKLTAAIIALARKGDKADRAQALTALETIKYDGLSQQQQIDLVRAIELVLARMGMPEEQVKQATIAYLTNRYPAASNNELSRGLIRVLSYLDDPQLAQKVIPSLNDLKDDNSAGQTAFTNASSLVNRNMGYGSDIARVLANVPPNQQMYMAGALSHLQSGWTPALREEYFRWYKKAASYGGGASYAGFMKKMRENALTHLPADLNKSLLEISGGVASFDNKARFEGESISAEGPGRKWTVDEAAAVADSGITKRDFARGEGLFISALCSHCHSINGKGGSVGPNLSQVGTRFSYKDMLEAIIEPGKIISDQYGQTVFYLKSGDSLTGRLISQDNSNYVI
ncbi:MAG: c-type cytochrome, partial [Chitinophagaceae bacterium]